MKHFKKMMALVIAMVMVLGMSVAAFAADNEFTINLPAAIGVAKEGGSVTYDIYQIFTGTYNKTTDGKDTLSDIHWGANTTKNGTLATDDEIKDIADLADGAAETARTIFSTYVTGTAFKSAQAAGSSVIVPGGYYLIKENITNAADGQEESLYVVEVVGTVNITRKASTTDSDKKLDDVNDSDTTVGADNTKLATSSDYDIGDEVPYHVTATISQNVGEYPKYHITLEDILESGKFDSITLDKTAITLDDVAIANTDAYTVTTTWNIDPTEKGFKVTFEFTPTEGHTLADLSGKTIAIDFTAKLGKGAAIGDAGNKNTLKVSYSNNPNETDGHSEGTTPDKEVITFTYKVVVDKTDGEKPLAGAEFTLYKIPANTAEPTGTDAADAAAKNTYYAGKQIQTWETKAIAGTDGTTLSRFSFDGIDDGTYVLAETKTPAGYNTIDPQVFRVKAEHSGLTLNTLTGERVSGLIEFTPDKSTGSLNTTIENKQGSTLPSTGGMGTTILYIIGAILVVGAGILLVTKKRMSAN